MKRFIQILLVACLALGASGVAEARGFFVGPGYYPYYRRPYYAPYYYSYYPYYRRPYFYAPVVAPYYPAYYSPYYYPYYGYYRPGFSISVGSGY